MIQLYNEDCLKGMDRITDNSVDMILADLPFGITATEFDCRIPFEPMWKQFRRVCKINAAICLFANGKFLIELAASNLKDYRYKWIWQKNIATGFLNAKKMPLKAHEDILVFYRKAPKFNPQFTQGKPYGVSHWTGSKNYKAYATGIGYEIPANPDGRRYPQDIQRFNTNNGKGKFHPTEKPVDMLEYFIKTYTDENDIVLDVAMGSGSTGVAAVNTNRHFIGFETDKKFFDVAQERMKSGGFKND